MKRSALIASLSCSQLRCARRKAGDDARDRSAPYNDGVRWGRFEVAASSHPGQQRSQFVDDSDQRANDLKITQYDVVRVDQPRRPRGQGPDQDELVQGHRGHASTRPTRCRRGSGTARTG